MQYRTTLPLEAGEVVFTFDDGPLPAQTGRILDILASECVRATFFSVGRMAQAHPEWLRRVYDAGHTVGSHTYRHPGLFNFMDSERALEEIDRGIAAVKSALGDERRLAPFFRFPGLRATATLEEHLFKQGIAAWSADIPSDDWRPIAAEDVVRVTLARLARKGRGIILMHDIQARTVEALPVLLRELKARGYRVVHIVPTGEWMRRIAPPMIAAAEPSRSRWPQPAIVAHGDAAELPAVAAETIGQALTVGNAPANLAPESAQATIWPQTAAAVVPDDAPELPALGVESVDPHKPLAVQLANAVAALTAIPSGKAARLSRKSSRRGRTTSGQHARLRRPLRLNWIH